MALVLVVEDDADIREVMIEALESSGYDAEAVADGRAALRRLRDGGTVPKLILLDSNMAGMDGTAFRAEQMSDPALAAIPVLLLSGGDGLAEKAEAMGVRCLSKPFRLAELVGVVDAICGD